MGKTAEIKLDENLVYIVSNGELVVITPPHHGDLVIKMVNGKAAKYDTRESHRIGKEMVK